MSLYLTGPHTHQEAAIYGELLNAGTEWPTNTALLVGHSFTQRKAL